MLNIDVMILKLQSNKQIRLQKQKIGLLVCVLCVLSWQFVCYLSFYLMPRCLCCPTDLRSVTGDGYHTEQAAGCRHRSLRPEKRKHLISSTNNSLVMSNRVQRDSKSNHWQILSTFFKGNKNHCVGLMLKVNNEAKWNEKSQPRAPGRRPHHNRYRSCCAVTFVKSSRCELQWQWPTLAKTEKHSRVWDTCKCNICFSLAASPGRVWSG